MTRSQLGLSIGAAFTLVACGGGGDASSAVPDAVVDGAAADAAVDDAPLEVSGEAASDARDGDAVDASSVYDGPLSLAETGLYSDFPSFTVAADVLPYDVRWELWSDGASKSRWLKLPPGTTIDTTNLDRWRFPVGTKAWKEFRLGGHRLETRYLEKRSEGEGGWLRISFLWNDAETEALAVPEGRSNVAGTTYDVPAREVCGDCHDGVVDTLIGLGALQLSAADGKGSLSRFTALKLLSAPPLAEPQPPGPPEVQAALGYLHGNCAHCHNDTSWLASRRTIRLELLVADRTPEETLIYTTAIGEPMAHEWEGGANVGIAPGDPAKSQVYYRLNRRGDGFEMPPVDSELVDTIGAATVRAWIVGLIPRPP